MTIELSLTLRGFALEPERNRPSYLNSSSQFSAMEDVFVDYGSCPVSYQSKQAFSAYVLAAKREAFPMVHHES